MSRCRACGGGIDANVFPGATVRCAACGVDNVITVTSDASFGDPYRGAPAPAPSPVVIAPVAGGDIGPLCPRCVRVLEDDGESALACDRCRGKLVEHSVLAARIESERPTSPPNAPPTHARARPREDHVRYASCPMCRQTMARMNFGARSGVVVDVCKLHGTWFDGDELHAVLDFVRAGGLESEIAHAQAKSRDVEQMARVAESALRADAMEDERAIATATELAGDLVFVLFGPSLGAGRYRF